MAPTPGTAELTLLRSPPSRGRAWLPPHPAYHPPLPSDTLSGSIPYMDGLKTHTLGALSLPREDVGLSGVGRGAAGSLSPRVTSLVLGRGEAASSRRSLLPASLLQSIPSVPLPFVTQNTRL